MNNKKNLIIGTLLVLIAVMGVAYAAFASNLSINGTAKIGSNWDVRITGIKEINKTSGATITSAPTYTGTTATFNIDLTSPGDTVEYQVTLENKGTLDALLENITANKTANNSINFEVTGINKGDSLNSGASKVVTIKISYIETETSGVKEENNLSISMTFVQNLGQKITPETPIIEGPLPIASESCFAFDGAGTITDYYDNEGNDTSNPSCPRALTIPSKIGGVSVTIIGASAFRNNKLTGVIISSSVTTISNEAFQGNRLTRVQIPSSVTQIFSFAFNGNQLTNIVIPDSVTTIGQAAFNTNQLPDSQAFIYKRNSDGTEDKTTIVSYGGTKKNVTIPSNVTIIGSQALRNNQLTSVEIPSSVTTIESYAFVSNKLTTIEIPLSVTSIGNAAFNNNQLPDDQAFIYKINGDGTEDKTTVVSYGGANRNIAIPSNITTISSHAFYYNELTNIVIPSSVTIIGGKAFANNQLTSVTIKGKSSSSGFLTYGTDIWGWATGYSDSNIVWNG